MASPDGGTPQVGWRVIMLMQLIYPQPVRTARTALPVDTAWKSVERERSTCSFKA